VLTEMYLLQKSCLTHKLKQKKTLLWNCFSRFWSALISNCLCHQCEKCDSVMVSWRHSHCECYIRILQSHTYWQLALCLCHWYFTYCDDSHARNPLPVLCEDHKLREKFVITIYHCNNR